MNILNKKSALAIVCSMLIGNTFINNAHASDFVIKDIQVNGLNRVSVGAVLLALPVKQGDTMTDDSTALAMKRLYQTGNFENVTLEQKGNTLVVNVKERPTIGTISFVGNEQIQADSLKNVIEQQGLRSGEPLNVQTLSDIQKSLEDFYHSAGMYQAKVKPVLTYLPRNRVDIKFEFTEGVNAQIEQINIVGNNSFDEDELLAQMQLRDYVPWWNLFANKKYDAQKFSADLESLKSFYLNRGYVNFKINDTSVEVSPDKKGLYLTINITEGDKYSFGSSTLEGNTLEYGKQMQELLTIEKGQTYSAQTVTNVEKTLKDYLGKFGYANSKVTAYPSFDDKNKIVNLSFYVEPGSRVYVSQVLIKGNTTTDDTVIRRELRQMDGTWLSNEDVDTSKLRLNRTGYFETVDVNTTAIGTSPDTVNLDVNVKEQPTGAISGGIGYGTSSGIMIQAGVSQNNLFGWGTQAHISAYQNDYSTHAEVGYTDPYFTIDNISLGGRIFYDKFDGSDADVVGYSNTTIGADVTLGYPLSENVYVSYTGAITSSKIDNTYDRFIQADRFWMMYSKTGKPKGYFTNYSGQASIVRTTLDKSVFPTSGSKLSLTGKITTPNSDIKYFKVSTEGSVFIPIDSQRDYVFDVRAMAGYGNGYGKKRGKTELLPFFDNFYLGGSQWLRGFSNNSVGPKAIYYWGPSDTAVGGNAMWATSFELNVPTPFIPEAYKRQIRTQFFLDAGALWDTREKAYKNYSPYFRSTNLSDYRASVGIGVNWLSPVGPLVFSFAKAIKSYQGDDTEVFSFNIGGTF